MNYSVISAEQNKTLPATERRGELIVYKLELAAGDSRFPGVELLQKPETAAPAVGDTLEGQITQSEFGPRFKKAQMGGNNKGGGGGRSPQEQKSIVRQGAEQRAALYLIAKALVKQHLGQDISKEQFKLLVDFFVEDAAA